MGNSGCGGGCIGAQEADQFEADFKTFMKYTGELLRDETDMRRRTNNSRIRICINNALLHSQVYTKFHRLVDNRKKFENNPNERRVRGLLRAQYYDFVCFTFNTLANNYDMWSCHHHLCGRQSASQNINTRVFANADGDTNSQYTAYCEAKKRVIETLFKYFDYYLHVFATHCDDDVDDDDDNNATTTDGCEMKADVDHCAIVIKK